MQRIVWRGCKGPRAQCEGNGNREWARLRGGLSYWERRASAKGRRLTFKPAAGGLSPLDGRCFPRGRKPRRPCEQSPAMREALGYMRRGALVPDSTVWEMVRERAGCLRCGGGFILDGFPRTLGQAESLQEVAGYARRTRTYGGGELRTTGSAKSWLGSGGRRTCEKCKAVFHVTERPPKVDGRCDHCDGKLFQREDDRPESIQVRLEAYDRALRL